MHDFSFFHCTDFLAVLYNLKAHSAPIEGSIPKAEDKVRAEKKDYLRKTSLFIAILMNTLEYYQSLRILTNLQYRALRPEKKQENNTAFFSAVNLLSDNNTSVLTKKKGSFSVFPEHLCLTCWLKQAFLVYRREDGTTLFLLLTKFK